MEKIITALEQQKNNRNRINVFLNNEFAFGLSAFVGRSLSVGQTLEDLEIDELQNKESREKAFQISLHYIAYKSRTREEVEEKLLNSGFDSELILSIIEEISEKGYIDDLDYAKQWVEIRSSSKPRSKRQMSFELKKKGISEEIINKALGRAPTENELALSLGRKYIRRYQHLDEKDIEKKLFEVLARRAFSYDVIQETLRELVEIYKQKN